MLEDHSSAGAVHNLQIPALQRSVYVPPSSPFKSTKLPDKQMTVRFSDPAPEGRREGRGPLWLLSQDMRSWLGKRSPVPHPPLFKHLRLPKEKSPGADKEVLRGEAVLPVHHHPEMSNTDSQTVISKRMCHAPPPLLASGWTRLGPCGFQPLWISRERMPGSG